MMSFNPSLILQDKAQKRRSNLIELTDLILPNCLGALRCLGNGLRRLGNKMSRSGMKPEEIVSQVRQVEVLMGQEMSCLDATRQIGVVEQTYYRWRKQYGGKGVDQLKELKRLQKKTEQLRRAVSDLTLDKLRLKEAAKDEGRAANHLGDARVAITSRQRFFPTCYGPECVAQAVRNWIAAVGAQTACIEPFVGELIPQITP